MSSSDCWKSQDPWTWREWIGLILLEFVGVVYLIKLHMQPLLEKSLQPALYAGTLTGLGMALILLGGLYVIALHPQKLTWREVGLRTFPARYWLFIVLWFLILTALSIIVIWLTSLFGNSIDNSKTEALREQVNFLTISIGIMSAGVISPIYEEIFYRGFIYRWLRTRTGTTSALLISSLIFTAAHYPTLNAMPVNFLSGLIFAWTYERSGSVIPAILIHSAFNSVAVLLTAFS